ncbi:hypothetical protein HCU01_33710 [Halomonas cupida]|uniref:Uncharacterized protein n=2 Tax=Halomonas cupida TaxID=44933 RepID=A0A1M7KFA6_9GAMM|nr:hypothetical protein HCU01_33710 [Halomonas cupida]SHM64024.1 hypothetical protein SAMN05660971_03482 [Halomonas cupida]
MSDRYRPPLRTPPPKEQRDSNTMNNAKPTAGEITEAVEEVIRTARLKMDDELIQIAVLKSAASQIEHMLAAESLRQAMYNALNKRV